MCRSTAQHYCTHERLTGHLRLLRSETHAPLLARAGTPSLTRPPTRSYVCTHACVFCVLFFFLSSRRALLGAVQSIVVPARFCFHFANAYEDPENGEVVLDMVEASYLKLDNEVESEEPVWDTIGEGLERGEGGAFFFYRAPALVL